VVAPHLFVVLDCSRPSAGGSRHSLAHVQRVVVGRGARRASERTVDEATPTLVIHLPDSRVSSRHARIVREGADFIVEDLGSRNGTRVNGARIEAPTALEDGDLVEVGHTILRYRAAIAGPLGAPADLDCAVEDPATALATLDPSLAHRVALLERVARSETAVLVLGETGTGKEVVARAIHRLSGRRGPLVAVNCGALPPTLLEAQLFGHVRGAFSGAVGDSPGLLRTADGGTLFLDEVGDLPAVSQAALLRALQEHEIVPVGGVRPIKVDFRVVAATHRPLARLVARGAFRGDLFARLSGFTFAIPSLCARREDLGLLVAVLAWAKTQRLSPAAGRALLRYDWPLNVRELHQTLEVAATLADGSAIDLVHLPEAVARAASFPPAEAQAAATGDPLYDGLVASLTRHRGNVAAVAREFGKARMQVHRWMRRFGLEPKSFRQSC
jgi:DNA-binding NtrC family response regulator